MFDKKIQIEIAQLNAEYDRYDAMYEMCGLQLNAMRSEAKYKVLLESGTQEDYDFLVSEAEEEVKQQQGGILSKLVDLIKSLIAKIRNGFARIFGKGNKSAKEDEEEVEIPTEDLENTNKLMSASDKLSLGFSKLQGGDITGLGDICKAIVLPATVIGLGIAGVAITIKKKKDIKALAAKMDGKLANLQANITKHEAELKDAKGVGATAKKGFLAVAKKAVGLFGAFSNLFTKALSWKKGTEGKPAKGELTDANDSEAANAIRNGDNNKGKPAKGELTDANDSEAANAIRNGGNNKGELTDANDSEAANAIRQQSSNNDNQNAGTPYTVKYISKKNKRTYFRDPDTGNWACLKNGKLEPMNGKPNGKMIQIQEAFMNCEDLNSFKEALFLFGIRKTNYFGYGITVVINKLNV